jgi:uncharacterized protein YcaQ
VLDEHAATRRRILRTLARRGPLQPADLAKTGDPEIVWGWGRATVTKAVLEALFRAGEITVASRSGNVKTYHLSSRVFPELILRRRVSDEEAIRHRLLSKFRAVGLLGLTASAEIWNRNDAPMRRGIVDAFVREKVLAPVEIAGDATTRYVLAEDLAVLDRTRRPTGQSVDAALLAPLDPFMWDRRFIKDLFAFDYKWEVYTPPHLREHGYYVLPILFGDALVGRLEPRHDREAGTITVERFALEPAFRRSVQSAFYPALDRALLAHAALAGASQVVWRPRLRPRNAGK